MQDGTYNKLTVEAGRGGWIVKKQGKPPEIFTSWAWLVRRLEEELTSKGDNKNI